ncbi:hypothetical protein TNCV_864881 [Trichonephila clavipes]|nr:hypothetical protein TNCV_864881 [Trichonephila clavipes]
MNKQAEIRIRNKQKVAEKNAFADVGAVKTHFIAVDPYQLCGNHIHSCSVALELIDGRWSCEFWSSSCKLSVHG